MAQLSEASLPTTEKNLGHPKYRPDIDGLRAVAVLSVVAFHAFPSLIQGGFVGVDVFFVISGFLISSIIFASLEKNSFSFVEFYTRRVNRIFPALLLVMTATWAFGWFSLLADEYRQLGKHIAGGAAFMSNFVLLGESGYFDNSAETKLLLHLWSLGIEEQFYLVWPLMAWVAWKARVNALILIALVGGISFGLNVVGVQSDPVATFYSPQTRLWELLVGSFLAYINLHKHQMPPSWRDASAPTIRNLQSLTGLALLVAAFALTTKINQFPGWWALLPTLGAALIISAGPFALFNRTILSNRFLVWFGLISFPLYLWHWPLLSFATIFQGGEPTTTTKLVIIAVSILLAWVTYSIVEKPLRAWNRQAFKTAALVGVMIFIASLGLTTFSLNGISSRTEKFEIVSIASGDRAVVENVTKQNIDGFEFSIIESPQKDTTLVIGDSNAEQYFPRFDQLRIETPTNTKRVILGASGACPPVPNLRLDIRAMCFPLTDGALDLVKSDKNISSVVLAAAWPNYFTRPEFGRYIQEGSKKFLIAPKNHGYQKGMSNLEKFIREIKKTKPNIRVTVVLSIPFGEELDPKYMVARSVMDFPNMLQPKDGGRLIENIERSFSYGMLKKDLVRAATESGAEVIDPMDYLCSDKICFSVDTQGQPMYSDSGHLRGAFVRHQLKYLDQLIQVN